MEFDGLNASKVQGENYRFLKLSGDKTITFATTEDIAFDKLPYFVSPSLSEFSVNDTQVTPIEKEKIWEKKWLWYVAGAIVLAIIGFVGYYFLQRWYDKKYEDSLFKDKNKLYNLANFVTKAKQQGKSDKEIKKSLKKANWSGEQIRYIMKKYAGERTGLPKLFGGLFGGKDKKPKKPRRRPGPNQKPKKRFINERK